MNKWLIFLIAGIGIAQAAQESGEPPQALSRYQRVAVALVDAPEEQRRAFAQIAVTSLAEIYIAEADLARSEARVSGLNNDKLHWAGSVDRFTEQLLRVSDALSDEAVVTVLASDPRGPVALTVGERRLMLSHPRAQQQAVFEQGVLNSFCRMRVCSQLLPSAGPAQVAPISSPPASVEWEFTAQGVSCSSEGLQLSFDKAVSITQVRGFCQQIHSEVSSLFRELNRQLRQGVVVEWAALSIERRADQTGHLVQLNQAGDAALLRLPLIAASPGFASAIAVWFGQQQELQAAGVLELEAADYGWLGSN